MKQFIQFTLAVSLITSFSAQAITKCKDANGKWHYGDYAVEECKRSKVTELNKHGIKVGEQAAPKTAEQLKVDAEEQARIQAQKDLELSKEEEKRRVLSIYESEADIDRQRDNQLISVQGNIDVHKAYLKSMDGRLKRYEKKLAQATIPTVKEGLEKDIAQAQKNVAKSEEGLAKLEEQKQAIIQKFSHEKELYRKLRRKNEEAI